MSLPPFILDIKNTALELAQRDAHPESYRNGVETTMKMLQALLDEKPLFNPNQFGPISRGAWRNRMRIANQAREAAEKRCQQAIQELEDIKQEIGGATTAELLSKIKAYKAEVSALNKKLAGPGLPLSKSAKRTLQERLNEYLTVITQLRAENEELKRNK
ncbi:hypothetical protein [Hymenobacter glacieicola]|uniref:Uncharacterized protein n=1 Tax=Hymenobacter glacieicola TaxID=1562124 RepID=A0ABQ1X5U8_9BACT|nr:hypothetical protein [Hymenobacter glacieicola]GGG61388.1 hypothetical protein GCM10011378_41800 [Hymenobacter glacieicola]